MLIFRCPLCGPRDEVEFRYRGNIGSAAPTGTDFRAWAKYLYRRDQVFGEQLERWLHIGGCRQWLEVRRDLRSNRILEVRQYLRAPEGKP